MTPSAPEPLVVHGWTVFAHPLFLAQVELLASQVEALKARDPANYTRKNATKRLGAIVKLAFDVVPQEPGRLEYRQGGMLADEYKHWFRAKFFQQYRLFFRYHTSSRVIVYAWVNDEDTKRAYDSDDDAYRVFRRMLAGGRPPDDWEQLLCEARGEASRLQQLAGIDSTPARNTGTTPPYT
jgi:toxin YhaV